MKKLRKYLLFIPVLLLIASYLPLPQANVSASTPFNANDLIDDFTFNDTGSMSASTINSWLSSNFGSSCISPSSFTTADPEGWSDSLDAEAFGDNVTAGQAIHDAADLYDVNPQVILTTLQKEQSIVTGDTGCHYTTPNPASAVNSPCGSAKAPCTTACTYSGGCMNIAMSYACPNYCTAKDEGFSMQLTLGTWLLRFGQERAYGTLTGYQGYETGDDTITYGGPMTAGYRQRVAGGSSVYYDGTYTTSDGTSVTITNGATASLYYYTPFISGNENFDNLFQGSISSGDLGFGSVYSTDTFTPHPNGTLVSYGGRIYLITNNTKEWITNPYVFSSYGYSYSNVVTASTGDANLPSGPSIGTLAPGTIFYSSNTPVYVMTYQGSSLVKQEISLAAFNSLGYNWSEPMYVPSSFVPAATASGILFANQHPAGTLVADQANGRVYMLSQNSRQWILGPNAFATNGYSWANVKTATSLDLSLPTGADIDLRQGQMLYSGGNIYAVDYDADGILKRPVGPWECFADRWHYTMNDTYSIPASQLPSRTGVIDTC